MYKDIGKKIKILAVILFVFIAFVTAVYGISILSKNKNSLTGLGFGLLIGGPVGALILSWLMYGFGELIDQTCAIKRHFCGEDEETNHIERKSAKKNTSDSLERELRMRRIAELHSKGLITDEDYKKDIKDLF